MRNPGLDAIATTKDLKDHEPQRRKEGFDEVTHRASHF